MEKGKFEGKWRDAFKHAEVAPSESVWTNIELDLATAEHERMKTRLFYFKLMAAASLLIALFAGAVGYYQFDSNRSYRTALEQQKLEIERMIAENAASSQEPQSKIASIDTQSLASQEAIESKRLTTRKEKRIKSATPSILNVQDELREELAAADGGAVADTEESMGSDFSSNMNLPSLVVLPKPALKLPEKQKETIDPVQEMMARLAERENMLAQASKDEKSSSEEKLWTSIGIAGGSFSSSGTSISPTSSNRAIQFNNNIADKEASAAGYTYAVGMNMGTRIANRWVIQGGLNYLTQTSDYTAHTAVGSENLQTFRPASINELQRFDTKSAFSEEKRLIATAPYNVNNSIRYLTIPVQAGYMVIDNKVGLQLSAGVSTDLFLSNVKTAEGGSLDNTEEEIGDKSPYRTTNFSGLVGTELSYRVGDRYRFALNPGIRYPFNSVYKDEVGVNSAPISFDLGLRFRYIFK